MAIITPMETAEGKNRPVATNFQFLKMLRPFGTASCWSVLVGATPLHLLSQTALPLKSPTGAFIAPLRVANAVLPQTLLGTSAANGNFQINLCK
jgi:hypothetical protein